MVIELENGRKEEIREQSSFKDLKEANLVEMTEHATAPHHYGNFLTPLNTTSAYDNGDSHQQGQGGVNVNEMLKRIMAIDGVGG